MIKKVKIDCGGIVVGLLSIGPNGRRENYHQLLNTKKSTALNLFTIFIILEEFFFRSKSRLGIKSSSNYLDKQKVPPVST